MELKLGHHQQPAKAVLAFIFLVTKDDSFAMDDNGGGRNCYHPGVGSEPSAHTHHNLAMLFLKGTRMMLMWRMTAQIKLRTRQSS